MEVIEDSSENEFDQEELEVALYSQTHFVSDTGSITDSNFHLPIQPFQIGVHEIEPRIVNEATNHSSDLGSYSGNLDNYNVKYQKIYGTNSFEKTRAWGCIIKVKTETLDANIKEDCKLSSEQEQIDDKIMFDKKGRSLVQALKTENERCRQELNEVKPEPDLESHCESAYNLAEQQRISQIISLKTEDLNASEVEGEKINIDQSGRFDNQNSSKSSSSVSKFSKGDKSNELKLLPFQITKKSNKSKLPQYIEETDVSKRDVDIDKNLKPNPEKKGSKKEKTTLPKLQDFLELPKSDSVKTSMKFTKQKSLSKNEAAVKHRKPQVQVKRPPPAAVPVRYRPDSDTDTEYSDSCTSENTTPTKKSKLSNSGTTSDTCPANSPAAIEGTSEVIDSDDDSENKEIRSIKHEEGSVNVTTITLSSEGESEGFSVEKENVSDQSDSSSSSAVLLSDDEAAFVPGLDFNLAGAVSDLLSDESSSFRPSARVGVRHGPTPIRLTVNNHFPFVPPDAASGNTCAVCKVAQQSEDNWKIDEKDRYNIKSLTSRYFAPRPIQCRNCRKDGHLSRDCPEPLRQRCIFCCEEGHFFKTCPKAICFNCNAPGHKTSDCREPKMDWNRQCDRCWMTGHRAELSPVSLVLRSNRKDQIYKGKKNPRVYCYNCGKKGHLGYECRLQRMNRFVAPSYPFIAFYDTRADIMDMSLPSNMSLREIR
ncbi:Zinc finger cchc domain-containing protein 7 [Plakobranchus ocellatus]|uniref:Zinc finger CCHC domain-containing protein 7 n=1 Tax=Plakobranchus ocellatus TaxID=259542 RepID=A0AAV4A9D7_9GAST|nr:Zinc finger cchc domain-containing protein 7 [Plakobranchus ocellatus]